MGRGSRLQRKPQERGNVLRKGKEGNETLWPENGKSMGGEGYKEGQEMWGRGENQSKPILLENVAMKPSVV